MTSDTDGRAGIHAGLVRRLLAEQFPELADLAVRTVPVEGWDNRTYRLGDHLTVRLPTAAGYVPGIAKEDRWLPRLAPLLPVAVPEPVVTGRPSATFDRPWSVRRWLPGDTAGPRTVPDPVRFADDLAGFLTALRAVDATEGPTAGEHSFFRGCPPAHYDDDARRALDRLRDRLDERLAVEVWDEAITAEWAGAPAWFHGDIAVGNLLAIDGRLSAVIDFGTCGVGDPACDLVISWTFLTGTARSVLRDGLGDLADEAMWARARGWALWKAAIVWAGSIDDGDTARAEEQHRVITAVLDDHRRLG